MKINYKVFKFIEEENIVIIKNQNNKFNIINNNNGKLFLNEWVDKITYHELLRNFHLINNKSENYISTRGKLFSKEWFDKISFDFVTQKFLAYTKNDKMMYFDLKGNIFFDKVDNITLLNDFNMYMIKNNMKYSLYYKNGKKIFNDEYDEVYTPYLYKKIMLIKNNKLNFLNNDLTLLFPNFINYEFLYYINENFILLKENNTKKYNVLNLLNAKFIFNEDLDGFFYDTHLKQSLIKLNDKWNYLNDSFEPLSIVWFDFIIYDKSEKKYFFTLNNNKGFFEKKFNETTIINDFPKKHFHIYSFVKENFIKPNGEFILEKWTYNLSFDENNNTFKSLDFFNEIIYDINGNRLKKKVLR